MDIMFSRLSNIIDLDDNTISMIETFRTSDEFLAAGIDGLTFYATLKKAELIPKAAQSSPTPGSNRNAQNIEDSK